MRRMVWWAVFIMLVTNGNMSSMNGRRASELVSTSIAKFLANTRNCAYRTYKFEISGASEERVPMDDDDQEMSGKISLRSVFRPDRFRLSSPRSVFTSLEHRHETAIDFSPYHENSQIGPEPGQEGYINRTINGLSGTIYLDPGTGELTRIHGVLKRKLSFAFGEAEEVEFTVDQKPLRGKLRPYTADLRMKYWHRRTYLFFTNLLSVRRHDRYTTWYICP